LTDDFAITLIRYLREYQALGTGGGLYHFRDEILRGNPDKFFVLNADIACSFPLDSMLSFHRSKEAVATVMGIRVDPSVVHKYGCIVTNPETSEVLHFVEKPETVMSDIISCGIYVFDKSIFQVMNTAIEGRRAKAFEEGVYDNDFVSDSRPSLLSSNSSEERIRLEQDVLSLLAADKKLYNYLCAPGKDFWMQVISPLFFLFWPLMLTIPSISAKNWQLNHSCKSSLLAAFQRKRAETIGFIRPNNE
jgi:mannose-1-phosphate guanylyltransferase